MYRTAIEARALRRAAGAPLLFAALLTTIPAATPAAELLTRRVQVADLNLASLQGQQTLARRLRVAIDQVCAQNDSGRSLRISRQQVEICRQTAWADAQHQLEQHGLPQLLTANR